MADDDNDEEDDDNEDGQGHVMASAGAVNEKTNEHFGNIMEDIEKMMRII